MHDFIKAAKEGNLATVQYYISQNIDIDINDEDGWTALMFAARKGHLDIVKVLIEYGGDINKADKYRWTALMIAAERGHLNIVKVLIKNDAHINGANKDDWTALMIAAERGHLNIVKVLIKNGAHINGANNYGCTALMVAADKGHLNIVKVLIEKDAHINGANKHGWTALIFAAGKGHLDIVKVLIENGADINKADIKGSTALIVAVRNDKFDVVKELITKGADINKATNSGKTALMESAERGYLDIIKKFIAHEAIINATDRSGFTALMWATMRKHSGVVKELIVKGAEINQVCSAYGDTALIKAGYYGCRESLIELVNAGSDLLLITKEEGLSNIVLYKLLREAFDKFNMLVVERYSELNTVAKLELLRAFNFMQDNYETFSKYYSIEEIKRIKASLEGEKSLEKFMDISSLDSRKLDTMHKLIDKLKQLKHISKFKTRYETEGINIDEVAIYKMYIHAKNIANVGYQDFTKNIKRNIKAFLGEDDKTQAQENSETSKIKLLNLPNEILAKIFLDVFIANKLQKDNSDNESILLCATDYVYEIYTVKHDIEELGVILHS
ncbi:MAG: ankyrin repeat-containing protein [Rickettsiaceae bacterium]|jgi:ankyrin repeat protein|nr:ankyrin repeat-containing protein [Rickettsiaceae bacterium]